VTELIRSPLTALRRADQRPRRLTD
jgi:hypothetical protein